MNTHVHETYLYPLKAVVACVGVLVIILVLLLVAAIGSVHSAGAIPAVAAIADVPGTASPAVDSPTLPGLSAADVQKPPRGSTPAFTSLSPFTDEMAGYTFLYPNGWTPFDLAEDSYGVVLAPDGGESGTWFSVEAKYTGVEFLEEDLPLLVETFHDALSTLPGLQVEWEDRWAIGSLIGVEAKLTYRQGNAVCKRWMRLLFDSGRQFAIVAQAASAEDYAYWEPMLFEMMTTVVLDSAYYYDGSGEEAPQVAGESL